MRDPGEHMTRKPEIKAVFEHYSPLESGSPTTHRLTTALGLKRVMNKVGRKGLGYSLRLRFRCRKEAEALGLRESANGDWVTAYMESVQVDIEDEQALDFPGFIELVFDPNRTGCERKKLRHRRK